MIRKWIAFALNPGFARMKILATLLYVELISLASKAMKYTTGIDGSLGGPISWIAALLMLVVFANMLYQYVHQAKHATKLLSSGVLPCTKCGYPLQTDQTQPCSECGKVESRSNTINYWKKRNFVNPLPENIV